MATVEVQAVILADSGIGTAGIPYVGPAHFPVVEDFSGNALTGIMVNMEAGDIFADVPGGLFDIRCLDFGGTDEFVDFGDTLSYEHTNAFSFSFWIKTTAIGASGIIVKIGAVPPFVGYAIYMSAGVVYFTLVGADGTSFTVAETTGSGNDGAWHHYVVTYAGDDTPANVVFYKDGAPLVTAVIGSTYTGTSIVHTAPLRLADAANPGLCVNLIGRLDEVASYNRALIPPEVFTIYNGGVPLDLVGLLAPTLMAYWRLGEGTLVAWTQELGQNFAIISGVTADSSVTSDAGVNYAINASPLSDSLVGSDVWLLLNGYAILGAESLCSGDLGENYAITAGLVADSSESPLAGCSYAVDSGVLADSGQTAWVFEELTAVAGCMADSLCSGNVVMGISCWSQMSGTSGFVCPGFDKVHHETPSPNPPATTTIPKVRYVPPSPNPPSYGVSGTGGRTTAPTVQTPMRQPTVVRKRQPT